MGQRVPEDDFLARSLGGVVETTPVADINTRLPHIQEAVLGPRTYYHDAALRVPSAPNVCNDSDSDDSDESTGSEAISPIKVRLKLNARG